MSIYINIVMDSMIPFLEAVDFFFPDKELLSSLLQLYDYYNIYSIIGWMDALNGVFSTAFKLSLGKVLVTGNLALSLRP